MSRSYKKKPYATDNSKSKEKKRVANSHVRSAVKGNEEYLPQNSDYKKIHESWNIHDYEFFRTKEQALEWYNKYKDEPNVKKLYPNEKAVVRWWYKCYRNK